MKLNAVILTLAVGFCSSVMAGNIHFHPKAKADIAKTPSNLTYPGPCDIEIINDSSDTVYVSGTFDDNTALDGFYMSPYQVAQYISLDYYGYCHAGMYIRIQTLNGYTPYAAYTPVRTIVHLQSYLQEQEIKATLSKH